MFYDIGALNITGSLRWETHANVGVLLVGLGYSPDPGHTYVSEVSTWELGGAGAHRLLTVPGRTRTLDSVNHRILFDASDLTFLSLPLAVGTPYYAIYYDTTNASDATRELIGREPLVSPKAPDGSDYTIRHPTGGIWSLPTL